MVDKEGWRRSSGHWFGQRGPESPQAMSPSIATSRERENHHRPGTELWRVKSTYDMMCVFFVFLSLTMLYSAKSILAPNMIVWGYSSHVNVEPPPPFFSP